jgi:hypothetical protein
LKCSPLPEVMDVSIIYSLKESLQVCRGLLRMVRRHARTHVAGMAYGMALVLVVDLCREGVSGSCICIFAYVDSRGQGRGLGHVPEPA